MDLVYNLTRDGVLQKRDALCALPPGAQKAEEWARSFSEALVSPQIQHIDHA